MLRLDGNDMVPLFPHVLAELHLFARELIFAYITNRVSTLKDFAHSVLQHSVSPENGQSPCRQADDAM